MPQSLEAGIRINEFWRWAVDKEVLLRAKHKPGTIPGVLRELERAESTPNVKAERPAQSADHGTVFYGLHDLHRSGMQQMKNESSSASTSSLKLPAVKGAEAPQPIGGLWRWPGGQPLPADVESAVTAATPSLVPSSLPSGLQIPSAVSASAPRSAVSASALQNALQDSTVRMGESSEVGTQLSGMSTGSGARRGSRRRSSA
mmetsp:Transcript_98430/g.175296  ORF Transcript_98430/g.175296 Transcript_98430/m.175296 type:complete len:202 (+) Transcript_98430:122-727(+)